ncbi:DUF7373 family lipoprotein [Nocardia aurantiaca]|uniref:Uncharacterized protein n=1 Tax=Nocardia aurantiaca TaxID=2675850 RepID=A0A6I3KLX6_9NOCA|nr:hypothetical protein [Nocardia aurantiaca]MTE11593.1 hypothetical protein [Nocardia aurantiaca]
MPLRFGRCCLAGIGAAVLVLTTACGNDGGAPDYGPYATHGDDAFDRQPSRIRGVFAESLRLADHIVFATDVDPDLTTVRGGGISADDRGLHEPALSPRQRGAAAPFGVAGSFGMAASNRAATGDGPPRKYLAVSLTAFRDERSAASAAAEMARVDFEASPDNAPVGVDAFPAALSHWRPGLPSLGSIMAWKNVVIRVYAELPDPDLGRLVDVVTTTYRKQVSELSGFDASPIPDPAEVPLDPDGLLTRLVRTGDPLADPKMFAAFGVRAYAALSPEPPRTFGKYSGSGVTALAVSHNKYLYRMRDSQAAAQYGRFLADDPENSEYTWMRNVRGLTAATCSQATRPDPKSVQARRYRCVVVRDGYVAVVYSNTETDVRQLAAAQYAIMGDPR